VDLGDKEKHNERKSFSRPEKRPKLNNHER